MDLFKYSALHVSVGTVSRCVYLLVYVRVCVCTHHTDELGQRHLDGDGDLLALIDRRSDQLVVSLWSQEVVHQTLLRVLCPCAWRSHTHTHR